MELPPEEARVLAALVEKEAAVPDSYPLTLNALRSACNQSNNRDPVVSFDDRTIEHALMSLKSIGLVRFVHPSHGGRTTRYRHIADERWQLEPGELIVLAMLTLRGPSTAAELRSRVERMLPPGSPTVDDALATLVARRPEPFAVRLERAAGEREPRFAHLLSGDHDDEVMVSEPTPTSAEPMAGAPDPTRGDDRVGVLEGEVAMLRRRLEHLERALGIDPDDPV
jgi:uncharacterized protein YceH (UPF0502 family)